VGYQLLAHAYAFCNVTVIFSAAEAACNSLGAHLVTIGSAQEDAAIQSLVTAKSMDIWLGLIRLSDLQWEWVNGEPLDYQGWIPGYPSNAYGAFNCAMLWGQHGAIWENAQCGTTRSYVCEWDD
jgi:hypothetical protein